MPIAIPRILGAAASAAFPQFAGGALRGAGDEILNILAERRMDALAREKIERQLAKEQAERDLEARRIATSERGNELEGERVRLAADEAAQARRDRAEAFRILGVVPAGSPSPTAGLPMGPDESGAVVGPPPPPPTVPAHVRQAVAMRLGGMNVSPSDLEPGRDPSLGVTDDERSMLRAFGVSSLDEITPQMQREWMRVKGTVGDAPIRDRIQGFQGVDESGTPGFYVANLDQGTMEPIGGGVRPASSQRPVTGEQRQTFDYYQRLTQALGNMDALEGQVTDRDLFVIHNAPEATPDFISNAALTPAGRQYMQALRAYTLAKLRKESGAAISAGEFKKEIQAAARNVGETDAGMQQKRAYRNQVASGFATSSGRAYDEFFGRPFRGASSQGGDDGGQDEGRFRYDRSSGTASRGAGGASSARPVRRGRPGQGLSR